MFTVETGTGFWDPLLWGVVIGIAFLLMYILRSFGKKDSRQGTDEVKLSRSDNRELAETTEMSANTIYWRFTSSFHWLFSLVKRWHTGDTRDYVLLFLIVLAVFLLIGVMI